MISVFFTGIMQVEKSRNMYYSIIYLYTCIVVANNFKGVFE